jgi:S1-C subfamily serine protease
MYASAALPPIVDAQKRDILTNNHVVGHADDITAILQDRRNFKGTLIGTDPATDVAVVKITPDQQHLRFAGISGSKASPVGAAGRRGRWA